MSARQLQLLLYSFVYESIWKAINAKELFCHKFLNTIQFIPFKIFFQIREKASIESNSVTAKNQTLYRLPCIYIHLHLAEYIAM